MSETLRQQVLNVGDDTFGETALAVFAHQRQYNPVYREWLRLTGSLHLEPNHWTEIPCAPISLFRTHNPQSGTWLAETVFQSSGTTGTSTSRHFIRSLADYHAQCRATFEQLIGPLAEFRVLALLPNYLEQGHSGLVAMLDDFLRHAAPGSGYYLHDHAALRAEVERVAPEGSAFAKTRPILLWGVTFALLDLLEGGTLTLPPGSLVMETGGMKGRRRELTRAELHATLQEGIQCASPFHGASLQPAPIYSEYGMTEMQSQAYLLDENRFAPAASLRIRTRDLTDPGTMQPEGKSGVLNVYDLANWSTLSFLQTDDLGRVFANEHFEVLGRLDHSIIRGCSQLVLD